MQLQKQNLVALNDDELVKNGSKLEMFSPPHLPEHPTLHQFPIWLFLRSFSFRVQCLLFRAWRCVMWTRYMFSKWKSVNSLIPRWSSYLPIWWKTANLEAWAGFQNCLQSTDHVWTSDIRLWAFHEKILSDQTYAVVLEEIYHDYYVHLGQRGRR